MANPWGEPGQETAQKSRAKTKKPTMYKVYLLNDDYTTMEFVVHILEDIFAKPAAEAVQIMLHVHKNGKGLAGVFTRDIAETKCLQVRDQARKAGYPLACVMEKE